MFHIGMHKTSEVNQDVVQRHISNREKALPVRHTKSSMQGMWWGGGRRVEVRGGGGRYGGGGGGGWRGG